MSYRVLVRSQLLTASFLVLAALTTRSVTALGHPEDQLTVKSREQPPAAAAATQPGQDRARPWRS
jgi:hypothetical protein